MVGFGVFIDHQFIVTFLDLTSVEGAIYRRIVLISALIDVIKISFTNCFLSHVLKDYVIIRSFDIWVVRNSNHTNVQEIIEIGRLGSLSIIPDI